MKNDFNRLLLEDYFLYNYECWVCGRNKQDAFHHITGRRYPECKSILNAAPVHNDKCHLQKSGWLHKREVEQDLLMKTFLYLNKQDYVLLSIDRQFIKRYQRYYENMGLGITDIA